MESDLNYDLFGGLAKDRNGQAITSFSRLLLRNSGQDSYLSGFRDAYMQRVAAGLCVDTMASSAALVFINGEFRACTTSGSVTARSMSATTPVRTRIPSQSLRMPTICTTKTRMLRLLTVAAWQVMQMSSTGCWSLRIPTISAFRKTLHGLNPNWIWTPDRPVRCPRVFQCHRLVPENNIKLWRDTAPDGADARWHFVLLDTDWGMGMKQTTGPEMNLLFILLNYSNGTYTKDCPLDAVASCSAGKPDV